MKDPFPGMTIKVTSENQAFDYLNTTNNVVLSTNDAVAITNYEYEERLNDQKRYIKILKPEYLSAVLSDFKNIMSYERSSQYIDKKTKETYNPNITGI